MNFELVNLIEMMYIQYYTRLWNLLKNLRFFKKQQLANIKYVGKCSIFDKREGSLFSFLMAIFKKN